MKNLLKILVLLCLSATVYSQQVMTSMNISSGGITYDSVSYTITQNSDDAMAGEVDTWLNGWDYLGNPVRFILAIDDNDVVQDDVWEGVVLRFHTINLGTNPTIDSAALILVRYNDNSGVNSTIRIRCQDSNSPATFTTTDSVFTKRTFRTDYVEYNFPADGNTVRINVTALIQDLLEVYTYDGDASDAIVFGFRSIGWGLSAVSWRTLAYDYSESTANTEAVLKIYYH